MSSVMELPVTNTSFSSKRGSISRISISKSSSGNNIHAHPQAMHPHTSLSSSRLKRSPGSAVLKLGHHNQTSPFSKIPSPIRNSFVKRSPLRELQNTTGPTRPLSNSNNIPKHNLTDNISLNEFEIGKGLGQGKFGKVYCVRHKKSGFICALKVIDKNEIIKCNIEQNFKREIEIQKSLNHPNITKLYGFFHTEKNVYLLMEYLLNGDIYKTMKSMKYPFNDIMASNYIYQIANALHYLHTRNIMHRDIKPENILLGFNNQVKLADFGGSIEFHPSIKRKTMCGTIDYLAPEIVDSKDYDHKVDIWALGVLIYELLTGKPPFEEETPQLTYKRICKVDFDFTSTISKDARDLINKLLQKDPKKRLSLVQVVKHPWIVRNKPFWPN